MQRIHRRGLRRLDSRRRRRKLGRQRRAIDARQRNDLARWRIENRQRHDRADPRARLHRAPKLLRFSRHDVGGQLPNDRARRRRVHVLREFERVSSRRRVHRCFATAAADRFGNDSAADRFRIAPHQQLRFAPRMLQRRGCRCELPHYRARRRRQRMPDSLFHVRLRRRRVHDDPVIAKLTK